MTWRTAHSLVAWIRDHAREYGADASMIVLAGSSAGAHLASMTGLTPDRPEFQPGFEDADTTVAAVVCLYGYYGPREPSGWSSPMGCVSAAAPACFVAHGVNDTLVPVSEAARFASALREASAKPVVWLPLPGGQHSFDLFGSPRFEKVIDGVEVFTGWVRADRERDTQPIDAAAGPTEPSAWSASPATPQTVQSTDEHLRSRRPESGVTCVCRKPMPWRCH